MHWKLIRALGVFGSLCVASVMVIWKIVKEASKPEKKDE